VTLRVGIVAVAAAVLAYLATWGLLVLICLLNAANDLNGGVHPLAIPPPNSWTLRAVYVAVALLVGLLTFRACRKRDVSLRQAAVPAGLALAGVLVVSGSTYAVGVSHEHNYLKHLPPGMSRQAGLAYGHQACDWLAAERWGRPPGSESLSSSLITIRPGARLGTERPPVYYPYHVQWHWANSTRMLGVYYIEHLDAQHPGPLTQDERQQISVIGSAWFELCPFQQWVHRPINGGGD
jgi:hypothetical protein